MDCQYCDKYGFCTKYSDLDLSWKCKGDADCDDYVEVDDDELANR